MELGLYKFKSPFREMIRFLLPYFERVNPNSVSWSLIPIGVVTALVYYFAKETPALYLVGPFLIFIRIAVGTLDGLMAVEFHKVTADGEIINRIAPEIADILLMLALIYSAPMYTTIGVVAIAMCWMVTFFGLIGAVAQRGVQRVGPVDQSDRVITLALLSFLQYSSITFKWDIDFIYVFFLWVVYGSLVTVALRAYRTFKFEF